MAYTVQLSDGRSVEFPDSVSKDEAAQIIRAQLGVAVAGEGQKRTGFGAALGKGFESLIGSTTTGLQSATGDANAAAALALKRAEASPYADQVSWDKVKEIYAKEGAVAAALEVARQVPLAIAEQLPQLGASAATTYAGAKLGALTSPVTGPVGPIVGGGLGFLASALPAALGSNVERQAAAQQEAGQPIDINMGAAVPAALAQTGLEAAGTFIPLGRRLVGKLFGAEVDALLRQGKKEAAEALARESLVKVLAKGAAVGVAAEVPTEVLQQAIERGQAGLSVLDEDALKEYGQTVYQTVLFAGPVGATARTVSRGGARAEVLAAEETAAADQRRAAAQAEKEKREAPEYIESSYSDYKKLLDEKEALNAQIKKDTKEAPLTQEDKDTNEIVNRQLKDIKTRVEQARQAFLSAGGPQALKKAREGRLELTPPEGRVTEPPPEEEPKEEKIARLQRELPGLERLLEQRLRDLAYATTPEESIPLAQRAAQARKALEDARSGVPVEPTVDTAALEKRIKGLEKKYEDARQKGDEAVVLEVVPELLSARKELLAALDKQAAARPDTGLFDPDVLAAEDARRTALAEEIGALREAAEAKRPPSLTEQMAQQREADRRAREQEELEQEGRAEREAMQGLAQDLRYQQRLRGYGDLPREQQTTLFPERRKPEDFSSFTRTITRRTEEGGAPELPAPRAGARAQVIERAAPEAVSLRRQLAEQYRELRKLTRGQREAEAPPAGVAGPYTPLGTSLETLQQIEATKRRIEALQRQLQIQMKPAVTTTTVGVPAEGAQVDLRPRGPLDERIRAMAQRIQSSAQVDEDTKALVAEVVDNLPGYVQYEASLAEPDAPRQEAQSRASQRVAEWMYRTLTGRGNPQGNAQVRGTLADLAEARRSETERLPSGEERRAVQQEFPEMPEPRATAFGSYKEFYDYLINRAPILVGKDGEAALSVVRMQAALEPLKAQIAELKAKETALNTETAALEGAMGAERATAQRRVELARADLAAARNELESDFEQVLALRDLAQQRYAQALDAAADSARALGDHTRELLAAVEAQKTVEVPAVGGTGEATVFKGGEARRNALRAAREKVEAALEAWMQAETYKRNVVQRNIGKDWGENTTTFAEYSLAKRQLDAARKKLKETKDAFNKVSAQLEVFSPLSDADLQNYLNKEAELYDAFDARMRRLWGYSGRLKRLAKETNLEQFVQQREAAHQAFLKALDRPGSDLTAAIKGYRASVEAASTRVKDELKLYSGTQAQFDAFERAQQNYAAAQEALAQVADNTQGTRAQVATLQKAAQELRTGAAALKKELRTKQSLIAARKTQPAQPPATDRAERAERERKSIEAAQAEQERLERLEGPFPGKAAPREVITFERAKELIASDHPEYVRLSAAAYDTSLSLEERAAAAKEADAYLEARKEKMSAQEKKRLSTANTHINNIAAAQKTVDTLRKKLANVQLTVRDKKTFKDDPAGAEAALNARREKARKALANAEGKLTGHRRKLAAALGFNKPTRTDPAQLRKDREAMFSGVVEKKGARGLERGERLGPRAIGPVTRPEVFAPREMRTGSEESRAGETTTQPDGRLKEALGVRQRDVPMTRKEQAEANVIAAENAVAAAKTPAEKRLAEAQLAVAEARYELVAKGNSDARAQQLAEAEKELTALTLSKVKLSEKTPLTAKEESAIAKEQAKEAAPTKVRPLSQAAEKRKKLSEVLAETAYEAPEIEILGGPREEVYFSRGATANASTTDSVRTELKPHFPDLGRVQVYDSVEALVKANPQYEGRIPDDARGFVDRAGNKAFLIAENINQGQALSVLLHEVGAHIGMKNLLGDAQYNAFVNAVERWQKAPATSAEGRVARAAQARVEAAQTPESQQRDELLAYAVEEAVNAGITPQTKSPLGQWLGRIVQRMEAAVRKFFGMEPKGISLRDLVNTAYGAAKVEMQPAVAGAPAPQPAEAGEILFSRNLPTASRVANDLVGGQRSFLDKVKANLLGFRAQVVDKLAPLEKVAFANMDTLKATQLMLNMRLYDQRNHFVSEALAVGVPVRKEIIRADGQKEFVIEAKPGANPKDIVQRLSTKEVIKAAGSADAANKLFTLYTAAKRAERVGFQKLGFGRAAAEAELVQLNKELSSETLDPVDRKRLIQRKEYLEKNAAKMPSEADIKAAVKEIEANDTLRKAFDDAREMYNEYNRDLLALATQTGVISEAEAKRLLAARDYIPYYRVRGGNAELVIGGEQPMRIGNIKDSPQLEELVGGEEPIFDFLTSSVQNTSMLLDMSLRNMAVKNAMWELRDVGLAKLYPLRNEKGGRRSVPENAVRFRNKGEEWFAIIDTDAAGVPSDLLVKGLAGIPTMLPAAVKMMAIPARILRRAIVANPVYMARQLFRDSVAAAIASGADITPVLSSLRQIGKKNALDRRGVTGGQVFTGMPEDMSRMLREMQTGRPGWAKAWSALERAGMEVDAATRRAQYESYRKQGLSEMEATFMALESMNFSKRGLSPTIHLVNTLVPFFNAQIQGLDVLYRSMRGQMPFNKRLDIRNKLFTRGALLLTTSLAYAAAMQDEEEYKNARPDEKYGNWLVRMPFLDKYADEPVVLRVPVPFELGYIFKALPEAIVNTLASEEGGKEALKALKQIVINTVPGGSSMPQIGGVPVPVPLPAGVKPAIELAMGRSFFTGRDIESVQEQAREPAERFRDNTSEAAKAIGQTFGISPVQLEYAIRGYTGGLGMALMQSLNFLMPAAEGAQAASRRMSDLPVIGTLFQPVDAGGIIDATYERMKEIQQVQNTYENMLKTGRRDDAERYAVDKADELSAASVAGQFRQVMGEITTFERGVRASPTLSPEEKREKLDLARQRKIEIAQRARALFDRRTPQASPA